MRVLTTRQWQLAMTYSMRYALCEAAPTSAREVCQYIKNHVFCFDLDMICLMESAIDSQIKKYPYSTIGKGNIIEDYWLDLRRVLNDRAKILRGKRR